jgi:cyclophilin family peptidyl-prolyl cis-trans isomerase
LPKHANVGAVVFHTAEGAIRVRLRKDASPIVAEAFSSFASKPGASGSFYRSEAVPEPGAIDNFGGPGPPYALVQGRLDGTHRSDLPRESAPKVRRGHACLIGGGPDFFIAVGNHPEWGHGHTVWGEVDLDEMAAVDAITRREVRKETWGETHVTVLVDPLRFTLTYEPPDLDLELDGAAGGRLRGASVLSDVD